MNHYQGLQDFAKAMPPDTKIDHTNGFDHCAIGAYGMTVGIYKDDHFGHISIMDDISRELDFRYDNDLFRYVLTSPEWAKKIIPTYGKLAEWLDNPNTVEANQLIIDTFGIQTPR